MCMRKIFVLFVLILFIGSAYALSADEQRAIDRAVALKEKITAECMVDPYTCSCANIPCEDVLDAEHDRAGEAYSRCLQEKAECERQRQAAIVEIEQTKERIRTECLADLNRCDCSTISNAQGIRECESAIKEAREMAQKERDDKIEECKKDIFNCDCSSISNVAGREECELAVIEARYQAQKERDEKIDECRADLDNCDCSTITDAGGREECERRIAEAKLFRDELESKCRSNPLVCDCSTIPDTTGREQCEREKQDGMEQATNQIRAALSKCFKDVDKCVCSELGIPQDDWVEFCEVQKGYGLSCKYEGDYCDKLEETEIYPAGMPPWLGTIFAREYSFYVEREKERGAREAAKIITQCINNPVSCECDKTPSYAVAFCERMRDLQIKCYDDNYEACMILENSANLPDKFPPFTYTGIDRMIQGLRDARESTVKGNAARKVGNMVIDCMDDSTKCDCEMAPRGEMRAFCEHKKQLVVKCVEHKSYNSCFMLDSEPIYSDSMPGFIVNYLKNNVLPKVEKKKIEMFNDMKKDTVCESVDSIAECRVIFESI
jgi:hypothetical protein